MAGTPTRARITDFVKGGGITELSITSIRKHIKAGSIPKGEDGMYDVETVLAQILKAQRQDNNQGTDTTAGRVRATKTALECQILQVKLLLLKGETIPIEDHQDECRTIVNITLDAWRFLRQEFAASLKDAEVLRRFDKAEEVARERALLRIDEEA